MPDQNLSITAIIPTKNRPQDLSAAVRSLLSQKRLPSEILIIDQSAGTESREVVESLFAELPEDSRNRVHLNYVHDPKISGLTEARNTSMRIASGDIWLFLDDDVVLEPEFLDELELAYSQSPGTTGVSGVVTNYPLPPFSYRLWCGCFVRGVFHDDRQPVYWSANRNRPGKPIRVSRLGGGLMSFRADAIRTAVFDENLRGVSDGEDVEFCARLGREAVLLIAPKARLEHNFSPSGRETGYWLRRVARSTHYLYWRNWNRGVYNRLCFGWLNVGYFLVASFSAIRQGSLEPIRAVWEGIRQAREAWNRLAIKSFIPPSAPGK